jgi:hypothetical protein
VIRAAGHVIAAHAEVTEQKRERREGEEERREGEGEGERERERERAFVTLIPVGNCAQQ